MGGYIIVFRQLDFTIVAGIINVKSTLSEAYNQIGIQGPRRLRHEKQQTWSISGAETHVLGKRAGVHFFVYWSHEHRFLRIPGGSIKQPGPSPLYGSSGLPMLAEFRPLLHTAQPWRAVKK